MTKYIVIAWHEDHADPRVGLTALRELKEGETIIQEIEASSWIEARTKVKEKDLKLYHNYGYGWFQDKGV